jgi:hypothetical protein
VGLQPVISAILPLVAEVFRNYDHHFFITSGTDGVHKEKSLHRFGLAVDIDFDDENLTLTRGENMAISIRLAIGPDYDVVFENDHFHIEYDPESQPIVNTAK